MTVIAKIVTLNMVGRFSFASDVVMATFTAVGRAGELAVGMASVTLHRIVSARERESGGEMVELRGCGENLQRNHAHQHEQQAQ